MTRSTAPNFLQGKLGLGLTWTISQWNGREREYKSPSQQAAVVPVLGGGDIWMWLVQSSYYYKSLFYLLIGLAESLMKPGPWKLMEKGEKYVATILKSGQHLALLIDDLLDAAAMKKGTLPLKYQKAMTHPSPH